MSNVNSTGTSTGVILVVEDEPLLRIHAADLLEDEGYCVVEATDADAALQVLESRQDVGLVFTDIQMPGRLDGIGLAQQVHRRWPHICVVLTSGRIRPSRAQIPNDGRFVSKPYRAKDLMAEINDLVRAA